MTGQPAALELDGIEVRYGVARALFGVSMSVPPSSVAAVVGPNGAGKSTLARAITGLVPVTSGRVFLAGRDVTNAAPHKLRVAGVVHLPEGRGIFPALSVAENLRMGTATLRRSERAAAVERALTIFEPLRTRRRQVAGTLSGGEQQMLSLARALMVSPRLVVADEMSLGLAPKMVDLVFENLQRAAASGVTIVLIEQFIHRALGLADQCIVLQRGKVVWSGPSAAAKDEILERYLGRGAA